MRWPIAATTLGRRKPIWAISAFNTRSGIQSIACPVQGFLAQLRARNHKYESASGLLIPKRLAPGWCDAPRHFGSNYVVVGGPATALTRRFGCGVRYKCAVEVGNVTQPDQPLPLF